jgi:hypothetical protein
MEKITGANKNAWNVLLQDVYVEHKVEGFQLYKGG